jgi:hypothetical protein
MLSGGRSQFVALKARMPWMDINQERHHAFAGYEGMVTMVAEIDKALFNPVWAQVRTPAPWETADSLPRRRPRMDRPHVASLLPPEGASVPSDGLPLTWPTSPKARRPARSTR